MSAHGKHRKPSQAPAVYLHPQRGACKGIRFIDSTSLAVCHPARIQQHPVFRVDARHGKTSLGWFYGFKLHLVVNDRGELLALCLTPGNTDDRRPVRPPKAPHLEMQTYTPEQANRLLDAAQGDRLEAMYVLMLTSGCRLGELLGLRWSALDPTVLRCKFLWRLRMCRAVGHLDDRKRLDHGVRSRSRREPSKP
jgi:integrase